MTAQHELKQLLNFNTLAKRAVIGAVIACTLLAGFVLYHLVFDDLHLRTEIFIPFLTISIGGAAGGVFYSLMDFFRNNETWKNVIVNLICLVVFFFAMWISLVFGLAMIGLWD